MADPERDQRLALVLEGLSRQRQRGEPPDVEAAAREHPDLADELRQLWAAAQLVQEVASLPTCAEAPADGAAAAPPFQPRRWGDYELLEEIARGGMGVVYKARHARLGRVVALKMILRGEWASPEDLARFRTEVEAAARLDQHGHIVPVYEVGEYEGRPYFSMKFIDGR